MKIKTGGWARAQKRGETFGIVVWLPEKIDVPDVLSQLVSIIQIRARFSSVFLSFNI